MLPSARPPPKDNRLDRTPRLLSTIAHDQGIVAHCLAQGRPAIVYPIDYDQFDNASRLTN